MGLALEKLPDWPIALNREEALAYTHLSEKLFAQLEKAGTLTPRKIGKNGEAIYLREQLDSATARLFGKGSNDIDDEFEGIGG